MLGALLRCRAGLANRGAELIQFALRIVQLATDNLQTYDERVNVDTGCCRNSIWHFNGGLSQGSKNDLGIHAGMRCCLSNRSTADTRSRAAFAGVGALSQSSRSQVAVRSSVSFSIWG